MFNYKNTNFSTPTKNSILIFIDYNEKYKIGINPS